MATSPKPELLSTYDPLLSRPLFSPLLPSHCLACFVSFRASLYQFLTIACGKSNKETNTSAHQHIDQTKHHHIVHATRSTHFATRPRLSSLSKMTTQPVQEKSAHHLHGDNNRDAEMGAEVAANADALTTPSSAPVPQHFSGAKLYNLLAALMLAMLLLGLDMNIVATVC